jgi:hypothetical protein
MFNVAKPRCEVNDGLGRRPPHNYTLPPLGKLSTGEEQRLSRSSTVGVAMGVTVCLLMAMLCSRDP